MLNQFHASMVDNVTQYPSGLLQIMTTGTDHG